MSMPTVNMIRGEPRACMTVTPGGDDREQLEGISEVWQEYDRTHDVSVIADYLAEDMMLLPPGGSAIEGKGAVLDALGGPGEGNPDNTHWVENIFVGDDLAVVHEAKGSIPDDADEPIDGGLTALDVYRRDENGEWAQIISMWNDQI